MDSRDLKAAADAITDYKASLFEDKAEQLARNSKDHIKISQAYASLLYDLAKNLDKNGGALTKDQERDLEKMNDAFHKGSLYVDMKNMAGFCDTSMDKWEKAYKLGDKVAG